MSTTDALLSVAGALLLAYILGAIVWAVCWAVTSTFLEKRPRLSYSLGRWRLLRWIAAVSASVAPPDKTLLLFEGVHDRDLPWRARLGSQRQARQTLYFTALGCLILGTVYWWGAFKRSVQWYAIEPPPDVSAGINTPLRPDSDAWLTEWIVKGVFWSKAACLQGIRRNAEAVQGLEDEVRSFVSAQRCISARSPHAPAPEADDSEPSDDGGDVPSSSRRVDTLRIDRRSYARGVWVPSWCHIGAICP
jgi:hypothetical protein